MRLMALLLFFSLSAIAQTTAPASAPATEPYLSAPAPAPICPPCKEPEVKRNTAFYREDSFGQIMLGYQYFDTWSIGKKSVSYTQILSQGWSLEFEYATSTRDVKIFDVDLGELHEQRYTLFAKFYIGNSFHFSFGPYFYDMNVKTNGVLQDRFGNNFDDTLEIQGYGAATSFGNRWQTKWGLTYGVDWIRVNVPLADGKVKKSIVNLDNDTADDVKRSVNFIRHVPTFLFAGVYLGYTF